jgi:hypothetical protein
MSDSLRTPGAIREREIDARLATAIGWALTAPVDPTCGHSVGVNRDGSSAKRNFCHDGTREIVIPSFTESADSFRAVLDVIDARGLGEKYIVALARSLWTDDANPTDEELLAAPSYVPDIWDLVRAPLPLCASAAVEVLEEK